MSQTLNYLIQVNTNFDRVNASLNSFSNNLNSRVDSIQRRLNSVNLNAMIQNINSAADGLATLNDPGIKLNANMKDLQAITGITGEKLKEIEGYARQNAKTFGGAASDGAESYKVILSKLSPEIAKVPKALQEMGTQVSLTSKLMGGDTAGATDLLTTAMNQYEVSLQNPLEAAKKMAEMNNIMAKSAQEGSAEFPEINAALQAGGLTAKKANIDFAETNAWFQVLDKSGKKGAEGGTAFRNVIATLSQGRFLPKDVKKELQSAGVDINDLTDKSKSFADRLKPLKAIINDSALITKLFGKENQAAGIAMLSGIDEAERLTAAVKGTNSVQEQASIVMESQLEKNKRLQAQIDDFKISIFNGTNGWLGYASVIGNTARDFSNLMPIFQFGGKVISTLTSVTKLQALWTSAVTTATNVWSAAQVVFNAIMAVNPVVWIVLAVAALIAVIAVVVNKTEGWGKAWQHTVNGSKLLFQAFVESVSLYFTTVVNGFMIGLNVIMLGWYKLKEAVGIGNSGENQSAIAKINADVERRQKAIVDGAKKVRETSIKAAAEFKAAATSITWKKEGQTDSATGTAGIAPPKIPGMNAAGAADPTGTDKVKKSNESVATGGTKHNYITITIKELNGIKTDLINGGKDAASKAGNEVADELLRILAMAGTATG